MSPKTGDLDKITTFPRLTEYLRSGLDWPVEETDFEELTFEYKPHELGLKDTEQYSDIEIRQLRPLTGSDPWGIFFVNFPNKSLPVTVLRRILGALTVRKRKAAQKAEQAVWQKHDLLFISAFGEAGKRQLTFAHFHDDMGYGDLPTLHVLGWDGDNTIRHLSQVHHVLSTRLRWPVDPSDLTAWRESWSAAFTERHREAIRTAEALSIALADIARDVRRRASRLLAAETEHGPLRRLHEAFKEALIHDLTPDDFADMYAQTIAYGLLSARISRPAGLVADDAALIAPATNPFLKELLETFLKVGGRKGGMDFDELGINDIVQMLRRANMEAVLRDFDDRNPEEDPVIHFYEAFLREYDAKKRIERGVFYTPRPVVSFIVRSVDEALRQEFGLQDGLADIATWGEMEQRLPGFKRPVGIKLDEPFVRILDPATGTGTFLVEVVDLIHRHMADKWRRAGRGQAEIDTLWNEYVPKHLLPRLYGYELMMAPYAIAHMKLGLKLYDTGYRFRSIERARIFLTNALEESRDLDFQLAFMSEALAHEAKAANDAKRKAGFTVIIGNPPYAGHSQNNAITWIVDKVYDYKRGYPELQKPGQAKWLQDDYVKFIRFGEWQVEQATTGILGYITNHAFLDNPTFKGMRASLLRTFCDLRIVDLHGSVKKKAPNGVVDQNVFEIQQGVAISVLISTRGPDGQRIQRADLLGPREHKYERLSRSRFADLGSIALNTLPPEHMFVHLDADRRAEYLQFPSIATVMGQSGDPAPGIVTTHDEFAISFNRREQIDKVEALLDSRTETQARSLFRLCSQSQWDYREAKAALRSEDWRKQIVPILYRPFDKRVTVFNRYVAVHRRERVSAQLIGAKNLALVTCRQRSQADGIWASVFVTDSIAESSAISNKTKEINYLFPLLVLPQGTETRSLPNLSPKFTAAVAATTSLNYVDDVRILGSEQCTQEESDHSGIPGRDLTTRFGPRDVFAWIYATLHSPTYRSRYAEFLRSDFPRIPMPGSMEVFVALVQLGTKLLEVHLLSESATKALKNLKDVRLAGSGATVVEKGFPRWKNGRVAINASRWFEEVSEKIWSFHIGGYQVCEKWLKDRRERKLSDADILHYGRVVTAISETIELMADVDRAIEKHGGWPNAFSGLSQEH